MNCLSKKNIYLVFGIGKTGIAIIDFLQKQGKNFYVSDDDVEKLKKIVVGKKKLEEKYKLYNINERIIKEKNINFLVLSPSVHAQKDPNKVVVLAKKLHIRIIADIDLFYRYLREYNKKNNTDKKIIGITGTNGKSTTTALIAFLLNKLKKKAIACGNIGLNVLSVDVKKYDYFIVEMSSYNLFLFDNVSFYSGVLLNITEDHLAYHGTMSNYVAAKAKLLESSNIKIICIDDKYTFRLIKNKKKNVKNSQKNIVCVSVKKILKEGLSFYNGICYYNGLSVFKDNFKNLPGEHNLENILCSVACVLKINKTAKKEEIYNIFKYASLFHGLPHRIQFVKKKDNVVFINDSKGTNADSTQKALKVFSDKDIYLIAGGERKTAGFFFLKNDLKNVKCVFLIGDATDSFAEELKEMRIKHIKCYNMKNAVLSSFKEARNNKNKSIVLLSPLCASFDQYKDFEDRGNDFIKIVNSL